MNRSARAAAVSRVACGCSTAHAGPPARTSSAACVAAGRRTAPTRAPRQAGACRSQDVRGPLLQSAAVGGGAGGAGGGGRRPSAYCRAMSPPARRCPRLLHVGAPCWCSRSSPGGCSHPTSASRWRPTPGSSAWCSPASRWARGPAGVLADRVDPRRTLGPMLMLGGALALVTIPVDPRSSARPGWAQGRSPSSSWRWSGSSRRRPCCRRSSPTVVKLQLRDLGETGTVVGRLSALGTAGAIVGHVRHRLRPRRRVSRRARSSSAWARAGRWSGCSSGWRAARRRARPRRRSAGPRARRRGLDRRRVHGPCEYESAYFCAAGRRRPASRARAAPCSWTRCATAASTSTTRPRWTSPTRRSCRRDRHDR